MIVFIGYHDRYQEWKITVISQGFFHSVWREVTFTFGTIFNELIDYNITGYLEMDCSMHQAMKIGSQKEKYTIMLSLKGEK